MTDLPKMFWEYADLASVAQDLRVFFILQKSLDGYCNRHEKLECKRCRKRLQQLSEKLNAFANRNANGDAKGVRKLGQP